VERGSGEMKLLLTPKPELLHAFKNEATKKSVEVWKTSCIVTNFGKNQQASGCTALINPGNPELSGVSRFAYFPRGGPVPCPKPKWESSGYWGGMDAGAGMLYPSAVVDGLVHQLGGIKLALQCKSITALKGGCLIGTSLTTTHGEHNLTQVYEQIVHTSPPFYEHNDEPDHLLRLCYQSALNLAFHDNQRKIACPLLGAGARGFPLDVAVDVAASESMKWRDSKDDIDGSSTERVLMFGLLDLKTSENLILAIRERNY
jgi:O-acetyl-ADP-ribose deacetylase (regulator of RNase III)